MTLRHNVDLIITEKSWNNIYSPSKALKNLIFFQMFIMYAEFWKVI